MDKTKWTFSVTGVGVLIYFVLLPTFNECCFLFSACLSQLATTCLRLSVQVLEQTKLNLEAEHEQEHDQKSTQKIHSKVSFTQYSGRIQKIDPSKNSVVCCCKLNNTRVCDEHLFRQVSTCTGHNQLPIFHCTNAHLGRYKPSLIYAHRLR